MRIDRRVHNSRWAQVLGRLGFGSREQRNHVRDRISNSTVGLYTCKRLLLRHRCNQPTCMEGRSVTTLNRQKRALNWALTPHCPSAGTNAVLFHARESQCAPNYGGTSPRSGESTVVPCNRGGRACNHCNSFFRLRNSRTTSFASRCWPSTA